MEDTIRKLNDCVMISSNIICFFWSFLWSFFWSVAICKGAYPHHQVASVFSLRWFPHPYGHLALEEPASRPLEVMSQGETYFRGLLWYFLLIAFHYLRWHEELQVAYLCWYTFGSNNHQHPKQGQTKMSLVLVLLSPLSPSSTLTLSDVMKVHLPFVIGTPRLTSISLVASMDNRTDFMFLCIGDISDEKPLIEERKCE